MLPLSVQLIKDKFPSSDPSGASPTSVPLRALWPAGRCGEGWAGVQAVSLDPERPHISALSRTVQSPLGTGCPAPEVEEGRFPGRQEGQRMTQSRVRSQDGSASKWQRESMNRTGGRGSGVLGQKSQGRWGGGSRVCSHVPLKASGKMLMA